MTHMHYATTMQKAQEASATMAQSYSEAIETAIATSAKAFAPIDPAAAVDQLFDFLGKTLEMQRETAKQLVGIGVSLGDKMRGQAQEVGVAVREQSEQARGALRKQAAASSFAEHQKLVHTYEDHTKAELQDELAGRDLAKTGNVDELRERLVADDEK